MNILVTGGAGYIGSHMVRMLVGLGARVTVVDSMEHGHASSLPPAAIIREGNVGDRKFLNMVFGSERIEAVIHFAGYISVEESVRDPKKYFYNNLIAPITLLEVMDANAVDKLIFSSTAAVYGNPQHVPIPEDHPKNPTNSYGLSKWCFEHYLFIYDRQKKIRSMALRYFNASGAALDGAHGEAHEPENHIIPMAIRTAMGAQKEFYLFGNDYPTRDGSCVRDYIHIEDLCNAHLLVLDALSHGHPSGIYNVGTGMGITNREVIDQVKKETGVDFPVVEKGKRAGDPAELVADSTKLRKEFGWKPKYSDIGSIVATAWKWHKNHPEGYSNNPTNNKA